MKIKVNPRVYYFSIITIMIITVLSLQKAQAVEIPPTPTAHYYGDADGNVSINLADIAQHNAYSSFKPCTYDTLQPQTSGQYWNTCDVDGNRSCNLSDIALLNSYTSFKPVTLGGDPWVLENINLPLGGNAPNTWIPFNINLYMTYSGAPSGRPGISVIAEIDPTSPGHGQLSGRSCTPVGGTRDQLAPAGAQCALAVTITDWQAGQEGLGLTESGTYGFQVSGDGDGDLKINFHIEEWAAMDIPSVTLSQTMGFSASCLIDLQCPVNVDEDSPISCPVTYTAGCTDTLSLGAASDCSGAAVTDNLDGTGSYEAPPQGEAAGPGSCVAEVRMASDGVSDSDVISIDEANLPPSLLMACPDNVYETTSFSCGLIAQDPDLPAQTLTCSVNPLTTCTGVSVFGCVQVDGLPQGEAAGPGTCDVVVDVNDPYGGSWQQSETINILESNEPPQWNPAPSDITIGAGLYYWKVNGHADDYDVPSQALTCSNAGSNCSFPVDVWGSGASAADCQIYFQAGPPNEACSVDVEVGDGVSSIVHTTNINVTDCIIYVDSRASGANDGTSWADAYTHPTWALSSIAPGCQIWMAEGVYTPIWPGDPVIHMVNGVEVYGGFMRWEHSLSDRGDPSLYPTILDGQDTSSHVLWGSSNTVVDGLTVIGGNADQGCCINDRGGGIYNGGVFNAVYNNVIMIGNYASWGGGMYNINSSPTVSNCIFDSNSAIWGGGMYNTGTSNPVVTNSLFRNNTSTTRAGAIYIGLPAQPDVSNTTFDGNSSNSGGAIYNYTATAVFTSCIFTNNSAISGGAFYNNQTSVPWIIGCSFDSNSASSGGALYNTVSSMPAIVNSSFTGNTATSSGGAVYNGLSAEPSITRSFFSTNHSDGSGGAIYSNEAGADLTNCILFDNSANSTGAGVAATNLAFTNITNSTISGNTANDGGGVSNFNSTSTILNSVIWGNIATTHSDFNDAGTSSSVITYSDVGGGFAGDGNIDADPLFVDPISGDFHLQASSPAIDSASRTGAPLDDYDGNPRPSGITIDMGALEYDFGPVCMMEITCPSNVGENSVLDCSVLYNQLYCADTLSVGASNTCTGASAMDNLDGTGSYSAAAQGEAAGPGNCTAAAAMLSDAVEAMASVNIDEENSNPSVVVNCGGSVPENSPAVCTLAPSDSDIPTQTLTCSLNGATTCTDAVITDCTQVDVAAQGEAAGPGSCDVVVDISDGLGGSGQGSDTLTIDEVNDYPSVVVVCPSTNETDPAVCAVSASDPDLPPQPLTCFVNPLTTCSGAVITDCTQVDVPAQGEASGPGSCAVFVSVSDNNGKLATYGEGLFINEVNQTPVWTAQPANIAVRTSTVYNSINGSASDADLPASSPGDPGYLECNLVSNTCSFAVNVSGSGSSSVDCNVDFTSGSTMENCSVEVEALDGYGQTVSKVVNIEVANVWYVDDSATGANNGTSWTDAFTILQNAINAASSGERVYVAGGNYYRPSVGNVSVAVMKSGVEMYGGFVGTETILAERGDPSIYTTVLDGQNLSYHVVTAASNARLDGFTVTRGNATGSSTNTYGGGLFASNTANLIVANSIFRYNTATNWAGAIYMTQPNGIYIENCKFDNNTAGFGGAILGTQGSNTVYIVNSEFSNNSASLYGGGFYTFQIPAYIKNCLFYNNTADLGGGIYISTANATISNTTIANNDAVTSGGGIYVTNGNPTITDSIMYFDSSGTSGPELFAAGTSTITITYTDVSGGYAGAGNINADPLFVGGFFLSQIAAGQGVDSPCIDAGSDSAANLNMDALTTRTDHIADADVVDMGYHYEP